MKKYIVLLFIFATTLVCADNMKLYVSGKEVPAEKINVVLDQVKQNPMYAKQLDNPDMKKQILQSIGMQMAILKEGDSQGLDRSSEYKNKEDQMRAMIYSGMLRDNIMKKTPSAIDIQKICDTKNQDIKGKKEYKLSHILVKTEPEANAIIKKLDQGQDFGKLAEKNSQDPGSKAHAGDLGWSSGDRFVPEFTDAAKDLTKGKYTKKPVKTQFGYHIIKKDDERELPQVDCKKLTDQQKGQYTQEFQNEQVKKMFDDLKNKYAVEVR